MRKEYDQDETSTEPDVSIAPASYECSMDIADVDRR